MIKYILRFDIYKHVYLGDVGHIVLKAPKKYPYQLASYYTDLIDDETTPLKTINEILIHGKEEINI
jgi:hypothetical protein